MSIEEELHQTLLDNYTRAGKEAGYWGNYFLRAVNAYERDPEPTAVGAVCQFRCRGSRLASDLVPVCGGFSPKSTTRN
jgi:hypothetical protein